MKISVLLYLSCLIVSQVFARISVMYAHDKISDMIAEQCINEMYPKGKKMEYQESDESCIIYCVLKKFGIMNSNGQINLDVYRYVGSIVCNFVNPGCFHFICGVASTAISSIPNRNIRCFSAFRTQNFWRKMWTN